jgi:polar amino acid transport system substrate-binding protein
MKLKLFPHLLPCASLLVLLAGAPAAAASKAAADLSTPVSLVADNWCPQHCEGNDRRKGYVVEIVEQALAAEGVAVNIVYRPWTRALRQTEMGSFDGLLTPTVAGYPQFIYHQEPVGFQQFCFYVNAGSTWRYRQPADLHGRRVAYLKESGFGELEKYIADHKDLVGGESFTGSQDVVSRIFHFLAAGRADAIIMTSDVYDWGVRSGDTPRGVSGAGCLANEKMAVGLSRARPERARLIAARLDSGIRKLRQSGRLKLILDDYGIALWPAPRH